MAFYEGWASAHPYKLEIYSNAFAGLNLSMLRPGDWYSYQTPLMGFDAAASDIVANANRILGHPVISGKGIGLMQPLYQRALSLANGRCCCR